MSFRVVGCILAAASLVALTGCDDDGDGAGGAGGTGGLAGSTTTTTGGAGGDGGTGGVVGSGAGGIGGTGTGGTGGMGAGGMGAGGMGGMGTGGVGGTGTGGGGGALGCSLSVGAPQVAAIDGAWYGYAARDPLTGGVWRYGRFDGNVTIHGNNVVPAGGHDFYAVRYDAMFVPQIVDTFGSATSSFELARGLAARSTGGAVFQGNTNSFTYPGGSSIQGNHLIAVDAAGSETMARSFISDGASGATQEITVDGNGDIIVTQAAQHGLIIFGGSCSFTATSGNKALAVAKFSGTTGDCQWLYAVESSAQTLEVNDITVDSAGDVAVIGSVNAAIDLGGGVLTPTLGDAFVLKVDGATGGYDSGRLIGGAQFQHGEAIQALGTDLAVVVHSAGANHTVDFGAGAVSCGTSFTCLGVARYDASLSSTTYAQLHQANLVTTRPVEASFRGDGSAVIAATYNGIGVMVGGVCPLPSFAGDQTHGMIVATDSTGAVVAADAYEASNIPIARSVDASASEAYVLFDAFQFASATINFGGTLASGTSFLLKL